MEYEGFYSNEAYKLIQWMVVEKNRIKATKIYRAACNMERNYRRCGVSRTTVPRSIVFARAYAAVLPNPAIDVQTTRLSPARR